MKKGGLTAETVETELRKAHGNLAKVGRHFGVTRQAVWKFIQTRPKLIEAANDVRESFKDTAEDSLRAAVKKGEGWAVCFFLKTQAKDRGYVEKQEVEMSGPGGGPLVSEVEVVHHKPAPALDNADGGSGPPADGAVEGAAQLPPGPVPGVGE